MSQRLNKQLNVSELDFDQIKNNLKTFLKSQDTLQDYDFEGSAVSTLLDVMAYVTHYNAVNANIGINETFLETAQNRGSVVGHARQLGYIPKSATGAIANVSVQVNNPNNNTLTLRKGHRFKSVIDNVSYIFTATKSYETNNAFFSNVEIKQGESKIVEYIFDVNTSEKFIIPDVNVDTSTLDVKVYENTSTDSYTSFTQVKNLNDITDDTPVYFLSESFEGFYEIKFGDGFVGRSLINGNKIEINYLVTQGSIANNAAGFTSLDRIEGNDNISVITNSISSGGTAKESIKSIKYNAPLTFAAQNRAVTPSDYKSVILENFNNANSIVVWGGENSDPPEYGKVFISIIPKTSETLSIDEKQNIIDNIIKPKSVLSITPEIVDPEYTYVALEVFYNRNTKESSLDLGEVNNIVKNSIIDYNDNQLKKFDGVLRYSTLLNTIDTSEKSIVNSTVRVYLKKRFVPIINQNSKYELVFSSPIYKSEFKNSLIYDSTQFTYNNRECIIEDYLNDFGERLIRIVTASDINKEIIVENAGFIDLNNNKIVLNNFGPSSFDGEYIELSVIPDSNDVAPKRNNIVVIDDQDVSIIGYNDPTSTGSMFSNINYDFVSRHG